MPAPIVAYWEGLPAWITLGLAIFAALLLAIAIWWLYAPMRRAPARLDLAEGLGQVVAFGLGEPGDGLPLRFNPETGTALAGGRNSGVRDGCFHDLDPLCITPRRRLAV